MKEIDEVTTENAVACFLTPPCTEEAKLTVNDAFIRDVVAVCAARVISKLTNGLRR